MTPTLKTEPVGEAVAALGSLDLDRLARAYRPDVVLDANVPFWRYQLRGANAARQCLAEELPPPGSFRVTEHRVTPMEAGALVELEVRFGAGDDEHLWREVHLLRGDDAGIARHTIYCTGVWDAAGRARQAAEAPMVERWP